MMRYVEAKTIGKQLSDKIKNIDDRAHIHSTFEKVINIELSTGEILTIGKSSIGNGPYNILFDYQKDFRSIGFNENESVKISDKKISFSNKGSIINLDKAMVWDSSWDVKPNKELSENLSYLEGLTIDKGDTRGLGFLLTDNIPSDNVFPQKTIERIKRNVKRINMDALSDEDELIKLKEFIGLGPGLTPSGDDLVSGFLFTINYASQFDLIEGPSISYNDWSQYIDKKTNKISKMELIMALQGKPLENIKNVIEALYGKKKYKIYSSVTKLLDRGSTSGTDILTGIILASNMIIENTNKIKK